MVTTGTYVFTGMKFSSALTNDDITRHYGFTTVTLDTKKLRVGIATIARTTTLFLMCHDSIPLLFGFAFCFNFRCRSFRLFLNLGLGCLLFGC